MKISDQKQRDTALDAKFSIHVESPAGAGKTGLLTARFMELLAMAEHPSQVLAMTFTRKAAAEMLKRIVGYLNDAHKGKKFADPYQAMLCDKAGRALKKHWQLAPQLLGGAFLRIMTIHSFCFEICRQAPVEAGLPPGLMLLEDRDQKILQKEAVVRTVTELLLKSSDDIVRKALESRLLMHNLAVDNFIDEMIDLVARRDQLEDLFLSVSRGSHEELKKELEKGFGDIVENHLASLHSAMHDSELGRNWGAFFNFLKEKKALCCDLLPHSLPGDKWESIETWRNIASTLTTKSGTPRKSMGKKNGGFPANFSKSEWGILISTMSNKLADMLHRTIELPLKNDIDPQANLIFDLMLITLPVIRTYLTLCRAKSSMDYVDIEQAALRAMGKFGNNVTESLLLWDKRLKHILIDEFQDTSFGQWDLIKSLVSGWEKGDGRSIFFVGDPKQSIYRFRKARVEIFYKAVNGIERDGMDALPVTPIQLSTNFRSRPILINWVNELFGKTVMKYVDKSSDDVQYNKASSPYPKNNNDLLYPECAVFSPIYKDDNKNELTSSELREKEADYLAFRVLECLKDLKQGESIGILLFTRTHLSTYLASLKEYGIYPRTKDGIKLGENHEIVHIANLARALVRPHDMLAWAACLRSLWLNIPVKQIYMIINSKGDTFFQRLKSYLDSEKNNNKSLYAFMDMVRPARARIGRDSLAKVLKDAWLSLCGASMIAATNGRQGVENIICFLDALEGAEAGSPEETLSMMEIILDDLYEPTDPGAASSPVEIMTVHGAKGLEFDYSFIPWMDYKPLKKNTRPAYLSTTINGRMILASRPDKRSGEDDFSYKCLMEIEKKRALAEVRRQFYVAATRAKKRLFLSGVSGKMTDESPLAWLMSHLEYNMEQDAGNCIIKKHTSILNNPSPDPASCNINNNIVFQAYLKPRFNPETLPYKIISPSGLRGQTHKTNIPGTENNAAAIRGTIIHQIFELISCNAPVPDKAWIENRLYANGLPQEDIADMAHEIADEVVGCRNDPFFQWLSKSGGVEWAASEWSIEGVTRDHEICSGNIDRVIYDGEFYWIIDYKTNQKQRDEDNKKFEQRMTEDYRLQLTAYAGMLKDLKGCSADDIKKGIYLTSIHKWIEIND